MNNILRTYNRVRLKDYWGSARIVGEQLREANYDFDFPLMPQAEEIRNIITHYCILPVASTDVRSKVPPVKSVLLAGPPHNGKHRLADIICTELGTRTGLTVCAPVFARNRYFPETNRPTSANSSLTMGLVIILRIKQKSRPNLGWFSRKNGKKVPATCTQSINQPTNCMGVRRLWSIPSYNSSFFPSKMHHHTANCAQFFVSSSSSSSSSFYLNQSILQGLRDLCWTSVTSRALTADVAASSCYCTWSWSWDGSFSLRWLLLNQRSICLVKQPPKLSSQNLKVLKTTLMKSAHSAAWLIDWLNFWSMDFPDGVR